MATNTQAPIFTNGVPTPAPTPIPVRSRQVPVRRQSPRLAKVGYHNDSTKAHICKKPALRREAIQSLLQRPLRLNSPTWNKYFKTRKLALQQAPNPPTTKPKLRIPNWSKHLKALELEAQQSSAPPKLTLRIPNWSEHLRALEEEDEKTFKLGLEFYLDSDRGVVEWVQEEMAEAEKTMRYRSG